MNAIEKMKGELTREEAVALGESEWWKGLPVKQVALAQLRQDRMCIPFGEFVPIVARAIGVDPEGFPDTALRHRDGIIHILETQ